MFTNIKLNFETKRVLQPYRRYGDKIPRGWQLRTIIKSVMPSFKRNNNDNNNKYIKYKNQNDL